LLATPRPVATLRAARAFVECQGRGEQFDPLVARSLGDRLELGIGDALGQSHGQK
jgi:hypothetical protein